MAFSCLPVTFASILVLTKFATGTGSVQQRPVVSCFFQSWAVYRPSHGQFDVVDVDATLCSHVVYCCVGMDNATNRVVSRDEFGVQNGVFKNLVGLKQSNPDLVLTASVGGWVEGSVKYSKMAASPETRKTFILSVVEYLRNHSLDGLNLDWSDPGTRGGSYLDKENYVDLCKELSEAFREHSWHLTVSVSATQRVLGIGYNLQELVKYVDLVYLRTTDYHGSWDWETGHVAPLYPRADEQGDRRLQNVNSTLSFVLSLPVPPEKLVVTLPLYGRTFILQDASDNGYGARARPEGFQGPYTQEDGLLGYNEICELLSSDGDQWTVHRAEGDAGPYAVSGDKWFSFDDSLSVSKKVEVVRSNRLAGVSVLGVDNDDFRGRCGGGRYPLLTQIRNQLVDGIVVTLENNSSPISDLEANPSNLPEANPLSFPEESPPSVPEANPEQKPPVKACFLAAESLKRESLGKFAIEDIDASLCTHIVFCYAILNDVTGRIDDEDTYYVADEVYKKLVALKANNSDLLVHVAIGGWNDGALKYSLMASTPETRTTFVRSVVAYLRLHNLDGLNLDWQDPATRGGIELDKNNYVLLCQELKAAFLEYGWQLTVSVSAHKDVLDNGYDLPALARHVDLLYVLTFAYHGPWEGFTGHAAPLYPRDGEQGDQRFLNINFTLSYVLAQNVPAHKVVPALPFVFRTYILLSPQNTRFGAPTRREGFSGPYTKTSSTVAYYEICDNIWLHSSWTINYESQQKVPYMVNKERWLGFEDNDSIREKLALAARFGVGGVMVWTIDTDDFRGSCGQGPYPLLTAVTKEMTNTFGATRTSTAMAAVTPRPTAASTPPGVTASSADHDGPFLPDDGAASGSSNGCFMPALKDVALDVLTCGQNNLTCPVNSRVPAHTVVYAVCWDTVSMLLRCHRDGYWRPYRETLPGLTDAGDGQENDGGKMRVICHPHYVNSPVCGQRIRYRSTGSTLNLSEFYTPKNRNPWVVGVTKDGSHVCTATLVTPLQVLTAAHCVAGGQNGSASSENLHVQIGSSVLAKVVDITVHPNYRPLPDSRYTNDVALLRLEKPLQFHSTLYPACVNFDARLVSTQEAVVFQYAQGDSNSNLYDEAMEGFDSSCHRPHYPCYFEVELERTIFCGMLLASNESLHHGSPGSPFLQNFGTSHDEKWTVSGVVSRVQSSRDCAQRVTVLSAVDVYKDWIMAVINEYL